MKKQKANRIITLLLAVVMVFGMMPDISHADDTVITINNFSAAVGDGAYPNDSGDYVWTANSNAADHRYTFQIRYSTSGTRYIEPGGITITIPKHIIRDRSGNFADYYDISVLEENDPEITENMEYVYREEENTIVIYNRIELPAGQNGVMEVSYLTSDRTYEYVDYGQTGCMSDDFYALYHVESDNLEANAETNHLKVAMDTSAEVASTEKKKPTLYGTWQSSWGTEVKPANDSDYYYLIWEIRTFIDTPNTQPFDFQLVDNFIDASDTEVIGYKYSGETEFTSNHWVGDLRVYDARYADRYDYVLTRHLKSTYEDLSSYTFKNNVNAIVHPVDSADEDSYASSNRAWNYVKPTWTKPTGHFMLWKWGLDEENKVVKDSESISSFGLTDFQTGESDRIENLNYYIHQVAYPYPWTLAPGADPDNLENYGAVPVRQVLWDNQFYLNSDGSETDYASLRQLEAGDYQIDKLKYTFYAYDADYDEVRQEFVSKAVTYDANDTADFYVEYNGEWKLAATLDLSSNTFTFADEAYVENIDIAQFSNCRGGTVYLKDDFTGWKLEYTTDHYYSNYYVEPSVSLLSSEAVLDEVEGLEKTNLLNINHSEVYTSSGTKLVSFDEAGTDWIIGVDRTGHIDKEVVSKVNSKPKKMYTVTWKISAYEDYWTNDGRVNTTQSSGKFYDLVPVGGEADLSSVRVYADGNRISAGEFDARVEKNWRETGREMLIVDIDTPADEYIVYYDSLHSWDSIRDNGIDLLNSVAYETGNTRIGDGEIDTGGSITDSALMSGLDNSCTTERFLYAEAAHQIEIITSASLGLFKKVKTASMSDYELSGLTYQDGIYTYLLRFSTDSETSSKNTILFDSLENYVVKEDGVPDRTSDWHGILQSIDTSQAREMGIAPVIYLSDIENLDLEAPGANDITDSSIWTKMSDFGDISDATAIAIDLSKGTDEQEYILPPGSSVSIKVIMKAPSSIATADDHPYAYNNVFLKNITISEEGIQAPFYIHEDYTKVEYRASGDLKLKKVSAEDHETVIRGIKFRLYGTSYYGKEYDEESTSTSRGYVTFRNLERGEYSLQEVYTTDDWVENHTVYHVSVDAYGNVSVAELSETDAEGRLLIENVPRIHTNLKFIKKDLYRTKTPAEVNYTPEYSLTPGMFRYAVSIYGIERDVDEDGNVMGLTFGPALGTSYVSTYKSHTPSGRTADGNSNRCMHNDSWDTIIYWNSVDPHVYDECLRNGCTHSVEYDLSKTTMAHASDDIKTRYTGDGESIILTALVIDDNGTPVYENLRWHPNNNYDGGSYGTSWLGWGPSRIRAMLNGADSLTDTGDGTDGDVYGNAAGTDIHKSAAVYTEDGCFFASLPDELQEAIGRRKTAYDSAASAKTQANLKYTYDRLWLLSTGEIATTARYAWGRHPLEGPPYPYFDGKIGEWTASGGQSSLIGYYAPKGANYTAGGVSTWLRSLSSTTYHAVMINHQGAYIGNFAQSGQNSQGVSPCFSLTKKDIIHDTTNLLDVPDTTFLFQGTSEYGTEYSCYLTSGPRGTVTLPNVEKGTYTLTEVTPNEEYIKDPTVYTVTVDSNGILRITYKESPFYEAGAEADLIGGGTYILYNEPYHEFDVRKTDSDSGDILEGAQFRLTGVSDGGKPVDMTVPAEDGTAHFGGLESGTYILEETVSPDGYYRDNTQYTVTITRDNRITITGLSQSDGAFIFPNDPVKDNIILITKVWEDDGTGTRPTPVITVTDQDNNVIGRTVSSGWVQNGDIWTYEFSVPDDTGTYYISEAPMTGYTGDGPITVENGEAVITNVSNNLSSLTIEKNVVWLDEPSDLKFRFDITLSGFPGSVPDSAIYSGIVFTKNASGGMTGSTFLGDGESVTITGIPSGVTYSVEEPENELYETTSAGTTGTISTGGTYTASFTNTEKNIPTNGFVLTKTVNGLFGDYNDYFDFTVVFSGLHPNSTYMYGENPFLSDDSGMAVVNVRLKHGTSAAFTGLPIGSRYRITEAGSDKYIAKYEITDSESLNLIETTKGKAHDPGNELSTANEYVDLGENITVAFTNTKNLIPPTGVERTGRASGFMLLASAIMLILFRRSREKQKT